MQYKNNTFLKGLYHMTFDDYDNNGDFKQLLYENVIVTTDTKLNDTDKTSFTNLINKIDSVKNNISDHKEILNVWKELIDKIHDIDSQTKNIPTTEDLKYTALKYNALYNIFNYLSESFNDKKYTELQQKGMQILNKIKSKISKNNILLQSKKYDKKLIRTKTLEESFSYELEEEDEDNNEEISQDIIKNKLENIKKYVLSLCDKYNLLNVYKKIYTQNIDSLNSFICAKKWLLVSKLIENFHYADEKKLIEYIDEIFK